jgi:hypothetical protein
MAVLLWHIMNCENVIHNHCRQQADKEHESAKPDRVGN